MASSTPTWRHQSGHRDACDHSTDWLNRQLHALHQQRTIAFRDRDGAIVLVTPSAKQPGCWQATWFDRSGPHRDLLARSAKRLLWQLHPAVRDWLDPDQADASLRALFG